MIEHVAATSQQAVNLKSLTEQTFLQKLATSWNNFTKRVGRFPIAKIILFEFVVYLVASSIIQMLFKVEKPIFALIIMIIASIWMCIWLKQREERLFEASFPDVLNMLASSVSAGESIMHAISYVGKSQDNDLGNEFRLMAERMKIGESQMMYSVKLAFVFHIHHFTFLLLRYVQT